MLDGIKMEEHALRPGPATLGVLLGECRVATPKWPWAGDRDVLRRWTQASKRTDKGNGLQDVGVRGIEKRLGMITGGGGQQAS